AGAKVEPRPAPLAGGLAGLLQMQRSQGNQAVQRALKTILQPKLTVNRPGDRYEQEADRVADGVLRMPVSGAQRKCSCEGMSSGACLECQKEDGLRAPTRIQRRAAEPGPAPVAPLGVSDLLKTPGQPLDAVTRAFFEPRFGRDLSGVRVHN